MALLGGQGPAMADQEQHEVPMEAQDRFLPIANISRIMKKHLPENVGRGPVGQAARVRGFWGRLRV